MASFKDFASSDFLCPTVLRLLCGDFFLHDWCSQTFHCSFIQHVVALLGTVFGTISKNACPPPFSGGGIYV